MVEQLVTNNVTTRTIDLQTFTLPVVKFVRNEVEMRSLEKAEMVRYQNMSNRSLKPRMTKAGDELPATEDGLDEVTKTPEGHF